MVRKYKEPINENGDVKLELTMTAERLSVMNTYTNMLYGVYQGKIYGTRRRHAKFIKSMVSDIILSRDINGTIMSALYSNIDHGNEVKMSVNINGVEYRKLEEISKSNSIDINTLVMNRVIYTMAFPNKGKK